MNIPEVIVIAGKRFDVVFDTPCCIKEKVYGRAEYDQCRIVLANPEDSGYHRSLIEETFIHECLHIINSIMSYDDKENVVHGTAELLYQVFQQILADGTPLIKFVEADV